MRNFMKKPLWSAFAVSLMFTAPAFTQENGLDELLDMDEEGLMDLKEETPKDQPKSQAKVTPAKKDPAPEKLPKPFSKTQKKVEAKAPDPVDVAESVSPESDSVDSFLDSDELKSAEAIDVAESVASESEDSFLDGDESALLESDEIKSSDDEKESKTSTTSKVEESSMDDFLGFDDKAPLEAKELSSTSNGTEASEPVDPFFELSDKISPDLKGSQRFTPQGYHQNSAMNVPESQVEQDKQPLKGQTYSLIPWKTLDPEKWLDIDQWLVERNEKDKSPDWKQRLRDDVNSELVGKVLQCKGTCRVYRGNSSSRVQHLSRIQEGDEVHTDDDSQAWVYLMDGTLVRISPKSSVSFQEVNWSKEEVFYLVRLNHGHLFWNPRDEDTYVADTAPETDAISLPLLVRDANQEHFERQNYIKQKDRERLAETFSLDENSALNQIEELNRIRKENWNKFPQKTKAMLVTPGATLISKRVALNLVYLIGGDTFFKRQTPHEDRELTLQLRGYSDATIFDVKGTQWNTTTNLSRGWSTVGEVRAELQIAELITKRIRTIELAREIWFYKFSLPIIEAMNDPQKLAIEHGYVLWKEDLSKRFDFLMEYSRRMETTNLRSVENLMLKMEERGETGKRGILSDDLYRAALNHYLLGLKTRNIGVRAQVREMNDLQYYVWILRKGKM